MSEAIKAASVRRREVGVANDVTFGLPMPPSVNHYFIERVVKSKQTGKHIVLKTPGPDALAFRKRVSECLLEQRIPLHVLSGKLRVTISVLPPDRRRRDLDNLLKPLLDALVRAALIEDDSMIDDLRIHRLGLHPDGKVIVNVAEIPGEATTSGRLDL